MAWRAAGLVEEILIDRRWWRFVPVPITVITLILSRGPYLIAGGAVTTYVIGAVLLAACVGVAVAPARPPWLSTASMVVVSVAGAALTIPLRDSWTLVLPYVVASIAARRCRPRVAVAVVAVAGASTVLAEVAVSGSALPAVAALAILLAVTMAAVARRTRAARLEQVELALAREQAAREEHARAAALAERARIAREVHDVLAHSLSALSLNLQGARLMLAREGASEGAQEQVRRAQRLTAEGLAETRRAVAALRDDPLPAARAIADLVTSARLATGTPTKLTVEGEPRVLPGPTEDALFRTAQEALSNARRHAPGAPVHVLLAYGAGRTELTVTDRPGHRPAGGAPGGYGLTGMRERAELIGGELVTGPTDNGWRVRLVVPS